MKKYGLLGLTALALVGCNDGPHLYNLEDSVESSANFGALAPQDGYSERKRSTEDMDIGPKDPFDPAGVYLAYRYGYGLVMPAASVKATADKHIQSCRDAGPKLCQVTGSNTQNHSEDNIRANVYLRAEPEWLTGFIESLKADVANVDGRIESENSSVEDLTRSILDTDARLNAQRTLRKRLENLLETRDAKLPDLLALERELARVQADIESATANLKALRARVSMSVVNISYTSERVAVSRSALSPIGTALKDFVGTVAYGLASVIQFFAVILPWLIFVVIPGIFAFRWFWRRRKIRKPLLKAKPKTSD